MKQLDSGGEYTSYINSHSLKNLDDTDIDAEEIDEEDQEDSEYHISNYVSKKQKKREIKNQRKGFNHHTNSRTNE